MPNMDKNVRGTNIFKEDIKAVHLTIKFDFNFFLKTIKFLDTFFIKHRKENVKQHYTKKTDRQPYSHRKLHHPKSLKNSIPFAQIL